MRKSLSEEFKDQKINDILEDYIALSKKIEAIPQELSDSLSGMQKAVDELPEQLIYPIEKIAEAVEMAEKEFGELTTKHRAILNQQLDESKLELRQAIRNEIAHGVSDAMRDVNQQLNQLSRKISDVSERSRFTSNRGWVVVTVLAVTLFLALGTNVLTFLFAAP